jgi:hypothetical protein
MKKEATVRARVPQRIADAIGDECIAEGISLSAYVRRAVLNQLARDKKTTVKQLFNRG